MTARDRAWTLSDAVFHVGTFGSLVLGLVTGALAAEAAWAERAEFGFDPVWVFGVGASWLAIGLTATLVALGVVALLPAPSARNATRALLAPPR